jgi:RNA polymerase sigma-70 factor (ECF subfamily)
MMEERVLVQKVLGGDLQAFRYLIAQHQRLVSHMIGRVVKRQEEAEELCQDVFLRVHDKLHEFSFQSKLSTWIATIAYRSALNHLRKQKIKYEEIPDEDKLERQFVERSDPESITGEADLDDYVKKLINELPVQYKTILTLYHIEQMTYPEICEVTQLPEGTVKNYLFRARNLLKEKVKKYLGKEELL